MNTFLNSTVCAGIVASALAAFPSLGPASAGQIASEGQGIITRLGANASAVTYWVNGPDGYHVVTTIDPLAGDDADNDGRAVVRFSSLLLPGQSQTISVPAAADARHRSLLIRRVADRIEVEMEPVLSD